jgi:eukaryotic-like serine/threonine-protein kinase
MADFKLILEELPAISQRLDEALLLEPHERSVWLDALKETDSIKAKLRDLLADVESIETRNFLGTLPMHLFSNLNIAGGSVASDGAAGAVVGPYRLIRELGAGGMGSVWLAERIDGTLKREVALKLPRLSWSSGLAERMSRERDILASLNHPNIARIYDAGLDSQARPYLALEYVEGEPIDVYCRQHSLSIKERLKLILQVSAAVAHAHARLVLHRDLKPANILVTHEGQVRLLDFGIAKLMEGELTQETKLTQQSGRALTLDYASPEQIRGEPIGTASDVYSLGVVAYEILTEAKPYKLKRESAAALEEAIALMDVRLASVATADRKIKQQLKGDLDAILNKALKKLPQERYGSVTAWVDDLTRCINNEPVSARHDSVVYRLAKFARRHRVAAGAASATALILVVGILGIAWQAVEASRARDATHAQLQRADATNRLLSVVLSEVSPNGESFTPGELLSRAESWASRLYAQDSRMHAEMLMVLGDRIDHTDGARALAWYEQALSLVQPLSDVELRAAAACRVAVKLTITAANVPRANQLVDDALRSLADVPAGSAARIRCLISASYSAEQRGDNTSAVSFAEKSVKEAEHAAGPALDRLAGPVAVLASAYSNAGRYQAAKREHERALALLRDSGLAASVRATTELNNAAVNLLRAGAPREALTMFEQVLALDHVAGTSGFPVNTAASYAAALLQVGRTGDALVWVDRAIAGAQRQNDRIGLGRALLIASRAQLQVGNLQYAEELVQQAKATIGPTLPQAHSGQAALRVQQGRLANAQGHLEKALIALNDAVQIFEAAAPRSSDRVFALSALAETHRRRGEHAAALARSEEALLLARDAAGDLTYSFRIGEAALALCDSQLIANASGAEQSCDLAITHLAATAGNEAPSTQQARALRERLLTSAH